MQWLSWSQHKPSDSRGVYLSCLRVLRAPTGSDQPKLPPLGPPATPPPMTQESLAAHPGAFSLDLSYMTTPAMVRAVSGLHPNSQTHIVAWPQPCPVTVDRPGRPGGDWHVAGAVRNQQPWLHFDMEDGSWEKGLMLNSHQEKLGSVQRLRNTKGAEAPSS